MRVIILVFVILNASMLSVIIVFVVVTKEIPKTKFSLFFFFKSYLSNMCSKFKYGHMEGVR
jgi:hypothetical protein